MGDVLADAKAVVSRLRQQNDSPDSKTLRVPIFAVPEVLRLLASQAEGSIRHIYPVIDEDLRARSFELSIWRQVAKRGLQVSRLYAVPHAGFGKSALKVTLADDESSGLGASVATLSAIPLDQSLTTVNQFVICDGHFVFRSDDAHSRDGAQLEPEWVLSTKPHDIRIALELWDDLTKAAGEKRLSPSLVDLEEPLVLSADLISGVAGVLCSGDHVDHIDCGWYHGSWQYMRLMDLVSTPTWHDQFYRTAFEAAFSQNPTARVLISGTADYSLLAYVIGAARKKSASPEICVLDQCATPLFACRWYAKQAGMRVRTLQADIFDAPSLLGKDFDIVTSDAFLTRFDSETVPRVVDTWSKLLREPGGIAVTTVRVHSAAVAVRDEETAIGDFVARARVRIPRWKQFVRKPVQELISATELYARRMVSNKIGNEHNIAELLESSGFTIRTKELGHVPGELYPTVYLRMIVERNSSRSGKSHG